MMAVEIFLILLISAMALAVLIRSWRGHPREIFSPRTIFTVILLYYVVIGPVVYLIQGDGDILGVYVRPVLWKGWLASALAFIGYLVGYGIKATIFSPLKVRTDDNAVLTISSAFFILAGFGMVYWVTFYGGGLNFLTPTLTEESALKSVEGFERSGAVYLLQLINLSFGAIALLMLYAMERRSVFTYIVFFVITTLAVLFFLKTGFRYRLAWLMLTLAAAYYLWTGKRLRLWFAVTASAAVIFIMGFIGLTRNYFGGLSLAKADGAGVTDYFLGGFTESGTFLFLSQVVDRVPRDLPHTTFDPFWIAITYPIPRNLWLEKPVSETMETMAGAFGTKEAYEAGMALPYYGEWYIAFGWFGVLVSSLVFGLVTRNMWEWYHKHDRDKFALVIYAVALGFMYVAFSRGLLAQVLLNFTFSLLPLMLVYRFLPKIRFIISSAIADPTDQLPQKHRPLQSRTRGIRR